MLKNSDKAIADSYDVMPYDSLPFPQSAPEKLEAIAHLFGLSAPNLETARILEIGTSAGINLLAMAKRHPKSKCFGIDLSSVQIEQGKNVIQSNNINNATLEALSVSDINKSHGKFDYIICHGVYSWVPPSVQSDILRVCSENLADNGLAYVSYNTYPGWKSREIIRDAMLFRGEERTKPIEKLSFARGMLDFLESTAPKDSLLAKVLQDNMPIINASKDYYLIHEFLELYNAPCYFKDFVVKLNQHGLSYLAESDIQSMFASNYNKNISEPLLRECNTQIKLEQYLDFLTNRCFRQTIIVKAPQAKKVNYTMSVKTLNLLSYAGLFTPTSTDPNKAEENIDYKTMLGNFVKFNGPIAIALKQAFNENYPATLTVPALTKMIADKTNSPVADVLKVIVSLIQDLLIRGNLRCSLNPVNVANKIPAKPKRIQGALVWPAASAELAGMTCNVWHEPVALGFVPNYILNVADGKKTHNDLIKMTVNEALAGRIGFTRENKPITDTKDIEKSAHDHVTAALEYLTKSGLFEHE